MTAQEENFSEWRNGYKRTVVRRICQDGELRSKSSLDVRVLGNKIFFGAFSIFILFFTERLRGEKK